MQKKPLIRHIVAENLRFLMDREDPKITQAALAKRVKVEGDPGPTSQKTISNLLHAVHDPSVQLLQGVAEVFGLDAWQIIRKDLKREVLTGKRVAKLIEDFYEASDEGRDLLGSMAEREAKLNKRANG